MSKNVAAAAEPEPDWVVALRSAVEKDGPSVVGRRIGYSRTTVHLVLKRRYMGDLRRVEQAVRGALMAAVVDCPVLGRVGSDICAAEQRRPYDATNHRRVRLFKTCRTCNAKKGDFNAQS